jgi:hypothetical protein
MILSVSTRRPSLTGTILAVGGVALLVWQVRLVGLNDIANGFREVGWQGFLAILGLSLFRFAARSLAWITLIGRPVPLRTAVAASITGDAIGNLSFLSLLVSEPAKAFYLTRHAPAAEAFAALTAENFFYSVSVATVIVAGSATLLATFVLPEAFRFVLWMSLAGMAGILAAAFWVARSRPGLTAITRSLSTKVGRRWPSLGVRLGAWLDRLERIETHTYSALSASPWRIGVVLASEAAFHIASIAESWLTLRLLTGSATLLNAFLLDTVNRFVNVVFRAVPMRVGVDEATTSGFTEMLGLGTAAGVTLALVRKARMLVWAVLGLALLGRRAFGRIL